MSFAENRRVLIQGRFLVQMLDEHTIATVDTVSKRVRFYRDVEGLELNERQALYFRDLLLRAFPLKQEESRP